MTTFVTGVTHPLGRVLVKELVRQGEALRILVHPESNRAGLELPGVEFIRGEVTDTVAVRKGITGCDRVCHVESRHHAYAPMEELWRVNRDGTRIVFQAAADLRVQSVVHVSALTILGSTPASDPADESRGEALRAQGNPTLRTRRVADLIAHEYFEKGLPVKIVYPGFGYGLVPPTPLPMLADLDLAPVARGKLGPMPGSGHNVVCPTYYKDIVKGIVLTHQYGRPGERYILAGTPVTMRELWTTLAETLEMPVPGRGMPVWWGKLGASIERFFNSKSQPPLEFYEMASRNWHYANTRARRELGWQPRPLAEGLQEMWAEYKTAGLAPVERERRRVEQRAWRR
jgi:dihydroflavonol-4-reductase